VFSQCLQQLLLRSRKRLNVGIYIWPGGLLHGEGIKMLP
jgi:hypothetical protein